MKKLCLILVILVLLCACNSREGSVASKKGRTDIVNIESVENDKNNDVKYINKFDKSIVTSNKSDNHKIYYENKAVVLTYHHIDTRAGGITITPQRFESDLKMLKESGFNVISQRYLNECISGTKKLPQNAVVITFDDGYESFYKYAYPLLIKYNMPGVVYIVSAFYQLIK